MRKQNKYKHMKVCRTWCAALPVALRARMTMVRLRRCAFAQCVGDALDLAGFGVKTKFLLAGAVVELFSKPGLLRNVRLHPIAGLWTRGELENALALAVLCLAASMEMDCDSERALRGVIRGTHGGEVWTATCAWMSLLTGLLGRAALVC